MPFSKQQAGSYSLEGLHKVVGVKIIELQMSRLRPAWHVGCLAECIDDIRQIGMKETLFTASSVRSRRCLWLSS